MLTKRPNNATVCSMDEELFPVYQKKFLGVIANRILLIEVFMSSRWFRAHARAVHMQYCSFPIVRSSSVSLWIVNACVCYIITDL